MFYSVSFTLWSLACVCIVVCTYVKSCMRRPCTCFDGVRIDTRLLRVTVDLVLTFSYCGHSSVEYTDLLKLTTRAFEELRGEMTGTDYQIFSDKIREVCLARDSQNLREGRSFGVRSVATLLMRARMAKKKVHAQISRQKLNVEKSVERGALAKLGILSQIGPATNLEHEMQENEEEYPTDDETDEGEEDAEQKSSAASLRHASLLGVPGDGDAMSVIPSLPEMQLLP